MTKKNCKEYRLQRMRKKKLRNLRIADEIVCEFLFNNTLYIIIISCYPHIFNLSVREKVIEFMYI